jgi:hypothetical protein
MSLLLQGFSLGVPVIAVELRDTQKAFHFAGRRNIRSSDDANIVDAGGRSVEICFAKHRIKRDGLKWDSRDSRFLGETGLAPGWNLFLSSI